MACDHLEEMILLKTQLEVGFGCFLGVFFFVLPACGRITAAGSAIHTLLHPLPKSNKEKVGKNSESTHIAFEKKIQSSPEIWFIVCVCMCQSMS